MYEQLVLERVRKWQREAKQEQMLAGLWKPRYSVVRYLIGCLGIFFVAPGTGMQHLEQPDQQTVCNGTRDSVPYTKDTVMNLWIHDEEQLNMGTYLQAVALEQERLVQSGFTTEEIISLLWLRQWYQTGGSDRHQLVRRWEFLKLLVRNGKLEA
jgi:hypothetical protein